MGQANQRKKFYQQALEHLKQFGADQLAGVTSASTAWLIQYFVRSLADGSAINAPSWQNQVFLTAQHHEDADIRFGLRTLMNELLTAGLEPGRVVFALLTEANLAQPELIGEFDTCEPLAQWVASQLEVPLHNVRVRYSRMIVPARAGLFGIKPTLELITTTKPKGEKPGVTSHQGTREEQRRQRLTFLVSVYTSKGVELDKLTPAQPAPSFELNYWGPKDATPAQAAAITPLEGMQLFDALMMQGFWDSLLQAQSALEPLRPATDGKLPVVQVTEHHSNDPRYPQGTDLCVRWRDVDMAPVPVYRGTFADDFIWQLERLNVRLERVPGVLPALPVDSTEDTVTETPFTP